MRHFNAFRTDPPTTAAWRRVCATRGASNATEAFKSLVHALDRGIQHVLQDDEALLQKYRAGELDFEAWKEFTAASDAAIYVK